MGYGVVEYDARGNPKCEICGKYYYKLMTHVNRTHKISTIDYKRDNGLAIYKSLCNEAFKEKMKEIAGERYHKNIDSGLAVADNPYRFKKGWEGRTKDKLSEQTKSEIISRGKVWGRSAYSLTKRANKIKREYFKKLIEDLKYVDDWCKAHYRNKYDPDITSETKLVAIKKGKFIDNGYKMTSWLIEIAKTLYKVKYKYDKSHPLHDYISEEPNIPEVPCYQEYISEKESIIKLVDTLPDYQKKILELSMKGYKVVEISDILKLKQTSVKSALWEARNNLKKKLDI